MVFTVDPARAGAFQTCLGAMCGVSVSIDGETLTVEVRAPFGAEREDQVRATVSAIHPSAVETA
jgi:hypothetical protein